MEELKKFKFEFTLPEIILIMRGCKKLPYEESVGTIQNIQMQYEAQLVKEEKITDASEKK